MTNEKKDFVDWLVEHVGTVFVAFALVTTWAFIALWSVVHHFIAKYW